MEALSAEELRNVNGGRNFPIHIHCTPPEPGTCPCVPIKNGELMENFLTFDF